MTICEISWLLVLRLPLYYKTVYSMYIITIRYNIVHLSKYSCFFVHQICLSQRMGAEKTHYIFKPNIVEVTPSVTFFCCLLMTITQPPGYAPPHMIPFWKPWDIGNTQEAFVRTLVTIRMIRKVKKIKIWGFWVSWWGLCHCITIIIPFWKTWDFDYTNGGFLRFLVRKIRKVKNVPNMGATSSCLCWWASPAPSRFTREETFHIYYVGHFLPET